ncbi:MAG: glutamate--cysteine ligase [Agarilytica sp.]
MGIDVEKEDFSSEEYEAYSQRLYECLQALKTLLASPSFGDMPLQIGGELENYIVDDQGIVRALNTELIEKSGDSKYTTELNRFNLEINYQPNMLNAHAFSRLHQEMLTSHQKLQGLADNYNAHIIPTGILPTLRRQHLTPKYMTNSVRYRALSKHLLKMRGEKFVVDIAGEDNISLTSENVALEGANTSFQYHLMVKPDEFSQVFNATQLATSLLVAISANSPMLLGKILWDETRIALFKQSIDSRARNNLDWKQPARVAFGQGWNRKGPWEIFASSVSLYPPIFAVNTDEDPIASVTNKTVPKLHELALHMGTTWPWNRPVYCPQGNGHIRIEMRALPAGPSFIDMIANAAFATGIVMGLRDSIDDIVAMMPFRFADFNFYRAAQHGLDASIIWPHAKKHQLIEMPITEVISAMIPIAEKGLTRLGIDQKEIEQNLNIIEQRLIHKVTGARWQKQYIHNIEAHSNRDQACHEMFQRYVENFHSGAPVHEWGQ